MWIPEPGASQLSDLTDVDTSGVQDDQVLRYDADTGMWLPGDAGSGGGGGSNASYAETIGDGSNDSYQIQHDLDSTDVVVQLWDLTGSDPVLATGDADTVQVDDENNITVVFSAPPAVDAYRVVVLAAGGSGGGGGGGGALPGWLSRFVGTTDATHFYWNGSDLAGFTEVTVTGSQTIAERDNTVAVLPSGIQNQDINCLLTAKTFTVGDSWAVPVKGFPPANQAHYLGVVFTDGTAATSNCVTAMLQWNNSRRVARHGTLTAASSAPEASQTNVPSWTFDWFWLRITYQAANTFRFEQSIDGATWQAFVSDVSKTMTPTHVGLAWSNQGQSGTPMFTFGPLLKMA